MANYGPDPIKRKARQRIEKARWRTKHPDYMRNYYKKNKDILIQKAIIKVQNYSCRRRALLNRIRKKKWKENRAVINAKRRMTYFLFKDQKNLKRKQLTKEMNDGYIRRLLLYNSDIGKKYIPIELIEIKRGHLKLRRAEREIRRNMVEKRAC